MATEEAQPGKQVNRIPAQVAQPAKEVDAVAGSTDDSQSSISPEGSEPEEPLHTYDSDWNIDSLLLFARSICRLLGDQSPTEHADRLTSVASELERTSEPAQKPVEAVLCRLINQFTAAVAVYYASGINYLTEPEPAQKPFQGRGRLSPHQKRPAERRRMTTLIGEEWALLVNLVSNARLLSDTDHIPVNRLTSDLMQGALRDIAISAESLQDVALIPHFGRHYELVQFTYARNTVVLGLPVSSLYCPWEWSFIWHEIAGIYVAQDRQIRRGAITALLGQMSIAVDDLKPLFPNEQLLNERQVIHNWAEELIEDSVGVLCLGKAMVIVLKAILNRHYADDDSPDRSGAGRINNSEQSETFSEQTDLLAAMGLPGIVNVAATIDRRHPPVGLRIAVAQALADRLLEGTNLRSLAKLLREHAPTASDAALNRATAAVNHLAQTIWDQRAQILSSEETCWSSRDEVQAREQAKAMRKPRNSDQHYLLDNAAGSRMGRVVIAAAAYAFYADRSPGDQIRNWVYGDADSYWAQHSTAAASSLLDVDAFRSYRFSETDYGTAEASAADAYDWAGRRYTPIVVSGVTCLNGHTNLSGNFRIYH